MNHKKTPSYIEFFLSFFWIGLTGFGGLAMSAHIRKHIVDKRKWLDANTFDSGLALCQIIPGAIVMQLTAYIGLKLKGIKGSVVAFALLVRKVDVIWVILGGIILSLILENGFAMHFY